MNSAEKLPTPLIANKRPAGSAALTVPVKGKLAIQRFIVPYRVYGGGDPTLVFVNGVQQSMAMWHSFVRRFSGCYRIVLFDLPHQGAGRIVTGAVEISLEEQVDILSAVIDKTCGAEPVTVCSASWGGVIAMAYAVRKPQRLKSLILASMGTRANQKMIDMISQGLEGQVKDPLEVAETLIEGIGPDLPESMKNKIISQFQHMGPEAFQAFLRHGSTVLSVRELHKVVDVSKVQCKTILLHGQNDTIVDIDDVRYLAEQIPRSELRLIKDVGHFLHLEKEDLLDVYEEILAASRSE
jgi:pimeloyl-ACP methyl ester carboxylesterase